MAMGAAPYPRTRFPDGTIVTCGTVVLGGVGLDQALATFWPVTAPMFCGAQFDDYLALTGCCAMNLDCWKWS